MGLNGRWKRGGIVSYHCQIPECFGIQFSLSSLLSLKILSLSSLVRTMSGGSILSVLETGGGEMRRTLLSWKVRSDSAFLLVLLFTLFNFPCIGPRPVDHEAEGWVCFSSRVERDGKTGDGGRSSGLELATASALSKGNTSMGLELSEAGFHFCSFVYWCPFSSIRISSGKIVCAR